MKKSLFQRTIFLALAIIMTFTLASCGSSVTPTGSVATSAVEKKNNYILPDSGTKLISDLDLKSLSPYEKNLTSYEIEARKGKVFSDAGIQSYFDNEAWYKPNANYTDASLSAIEKQNLAYLNIILTVAKQHYIEAPKELSLDIDNNTFEDDITYSFTPGDSKVTFTDTTVRWQPLVVKVTGTATPAPVVTLPPPEASTPTDITVPGTVQKVFLTDLIFADGTQEYVIESKDGNDIVNTVVKIYIKQKSAKKPENNVISIQSAGTFLGDITAPGTLTYKTNYNVFYANNYSTQIGHFVRPYEYAFSATRLLAEQRAYAHTGLSLDVTMKQDLQTRVSKLNLKNSILLKKGSSYKIIETNDGINTGDNFYVIVSDGTNTGYVEMDKKNKIFSEAMNKTTKKVEKTPLGYFNEFFDGLTDNINGAQ